MKKIITFFCIVASMQNLSAQNSNFRRDSLYQVLKQAETPAKQVEAWARISEDYAYAGQPDSINMPMSKYSK